MEVVTLNPEYKQILVTGGAGFIGSHLCEEALKQGRQVICLDDFSNANMETIMPFMSNKNFTLVKGNVCNILDDEKLLQLFKGVDLVFHEACSRFYVCIEDPELDLRINAWGTFNVLEASRRANVKKVVHASTGSVYIELVRDRKEWVVIRIADHNQVYHKWITTYSLSPSEHSFEEIIEILKKPFGESGDVLL